MKQLVLASTSPRRRELLEQVGFTFTVVAPDYEEDMTLHMPVEELASTLALGKATSVANDDSVTLGADTFIEYNGELLGKPGTARAATEMLRQLRGQPHHVHTGYAIVSGDKIHADCVTSTVYMRDYSDDEIDWYVNTGEPLDRAGAYSANGMGALLIERINGDFSAILGLPVSPVAQALQSFEIKPTSQGVDHVPQH